jgi:dTDP-4-dehydrorhamnose 3,5-epimerase
MHYQTHGSEEAKLVRCISGRILDVCIDIRRDSDTFGQHIMVELTAMNDAMLYLPRGTAHGFLSLDDNCQVFYQVSSFYDPVNERGIRWNDPFFSINWPVTHPILSEKDQSYADFLK